MGYMFGNAIKFNQDISRWDIGNVAQITYMFAEATKFNQLIGT